MYHSNSCKIFNVELPFDSNHSGYCIDLTSIEKDKEYIKE